MTGSELVLALLRCGICAISLDSTLSSRVGVRVCVSLLNSEDDFVALEERLGLFSELYRADD